MNLISVIPYVTGGLSLVAFVVAAVFYGYRARLRQRTEIILAAPKIDRVAAIDATADFLRIDTSDLNNKQKETIILRQLNIRARRDQMVFALSLVLACVFGVVAFLAIPAHSGETVVNGDKIKKDTASKTDSLTTQPGSDQHPPPPPMITTNYVVCVGQNAENCPQGSVHLECGSVVADWATRECSTYSETKLDDVSGNKCGYYTAQVTCQKVLGR